MKAYRDTRPCLQNVIDFGTPFLAGSCIWLFSGSIGWSLLGVLVGLAVGFSISAQITVIYGCGPDWEELRSGITNFDKYSVNDDRFYMNLRGKNFNIYREDFPEGGYAIGVELPWSDWGELLKRTPLRERLQEFSGNIEEGKNGLFAEARNGVDDVMQMIACLIEIEGAQLDDLEFNARFRSGAGFYGLFGRGDNLKKTVGIEK